MFYFNNNHHQKDADQIIPSRVNDLRVVDIDYYKKYVKISFTAPGDNYDLGRGIYIFKII